MTAGLAIFGAVLSTLILPLPEELALLGAGWVAHSGALPLWGAWLASWAGVMIGDTATYTVGRFFLPRLLRTRIGRRLGAPELLQWAEDLVRRHAFRAILIGRFLVALRGPVYLAIGAARHPSLRFAIIDGAVGTIAGAALVGLGYFFGRSARLVAQVRCGEIAVPMSLALILTTPPLPQSRLTRN